MVLVLKEKLNRIEAVKVQYKQDLKENGFLKKVAIYGQSRVFWMEPGYKSPKGYSIVARKDGSLVVTGHNQEFGESVGDGDYIVAYPCGKIEVMSDKEIHTKYIVEPADIEEDSNVSDNK